jgi:acyl-CoA thioesterase FadM
VAVTAEDADENGLLTDTAIERLTSRARDEYLALCKTVEARDVAVLETQIRNRSATVSDQVSVSAGVSEIFATRFVLSIRIRAVGADVAADVACSMSPGAELTKAMRDEFIALAHNARHHN